jgi:HD-GYP domain-containing protein (c-di-GMP phosphodiesterase class II)/FixJ family two-component response regulator
MRRKSQTTASNYKILVVDDEIGIIDSLSVVLKRSGYDFTGIIDPLEAIEKVKNEHFDLMILDFLMYPIHGDKVVQTIREFNSELYILLLTGHKDLAPPLETIRELDIQGYCEKSDRFDQLLLLVESGIKSISQMRTIRKFKDGLNKILQAVPKIYQLQPIGSIMEDILTEIMPLVDSENAFILVDDTADIISGNKSIFKGIGKYKAEIGCFMEMLGPSLMEQIGCARISRQVVKLEHGIILPLINELQQAIGVICVEGKNIDEGIKLLEIYSNQAASSINNAFLHSLVNVKNEELNKTYDQLKLRYMDTIEALRQAVDAKDIYTRGHSDRVAYFAVRIGTAMGLSAAELETLRISGIFHDVGKIGTADDILLKTDRLDEKEYHEIQKHPLKGARILSAVSMFKDVVPVVKCHHEWVDGTGYPEGYKKNEIPLLARIISISDAFDAMMSDRRYRSKLNLQEARQQLINGAGSQFDKEIAEIFLSLIDGEGYGKMLEETASTYE